MAENSPMPTDRTLGGKLRQLRENARLTQKDVAQVVGVTEAGYRHYEADRAKPSLEDMQKLASALGLSSRELMERLGLISALKETEGDGLSVYAIATSIDRSTELLPEDREVLVKMIWRALRVAQMTRGEPQEQ